MIPLNMMWCILALLGGQAHGLLTPAQHNVDELYAIIQKLNTSVRNLELNDARQNATINNVLQGSSNTQSVGFYAKLTHTISQLGDGQTIEFDTVVTNVGNGYDPRHGHFIAPVNGMYLISASVMSQPGYHLYCQMIKNGAIVTRFYGGTEDYQGDTQTVVLELQKGDMLWIRHSSGQSNERFNGYNSYFSGFLIKAY